MGHQKLGYIYRLYFGGPAGDHPAGPFGFGTIYKRALSLARTIHEENHLIVI
jgi:hypothetical protein